MITVFACPKAFDDPHIALIQRNAIVSWTKLVPRPEVILFGNEPGIAQICNELDLRHFADVEVNRRGTPLLDDIFRKANEIAQHSVVCYINSDIIIFPEEFGGAVQRVASRFPEFLAVGQRWGLWVLSPIDFRSDGWASELRRKAVDFNDPHGPHAMDYFISPRGLLSVMPPLLIGRPGWDTWFIANALKRKVPVIDISECAMVIHQAHHHDHVGGLEVYRSGPETMHNQALIASDVYRYSMHWATYRLVHRGFKSGFLRRLKTRARYALWYWLVCKSSALRHKLGLSKVLEDAAIK